MENQFALFVVDVTEPLLLDLKFLQELLGHLQLLVFACILSIDIIGFLIFAGLRCALCKLLRWLLFSIIAGLR